MNKLIIAGGTGFLGKAIADHYKTSTKEIVILSRSKSHTIENIRYLNWDGKTAGTWAKEIDGADVLINLTGKSVDCRYNEKNKAEIISSRVDATTVLGEVIKNSSQPPKVWMNAASATIYRHSEDKAMDESIGEQGEGFSVNVCQLWEKAFNEANTPRTRKITLRISMVLGKGGGVFPVMRKLVKRGLGGRMGDGKQYVSWIHEEDLLKMLDWFIDHSDCDGPYNIASPDPVPNSVFMQLMRKHLRVTFGMPATKWMLEIGAWLIGTETELVLKSRHVIPTKILKEGFQFKFASADAAIKNLSNA